MFTIPCWDAGNYRSCSPSSFHTWQFWADGGLLLLYLVAALAVLFVAAVLRAKWREANPLTPAQQAARQARARHQESIRTEAAKLNAVQDRRNAVARERRRQRGPWWW
jgi:hypothetical protein